MNNILCIAEIRNGALRQVSFELINVARKIAGALDGKIEAAVVGANVAKLADDFAKGGVSTLYLIDDPGLAQFAPEAYSAALAQIIREAKPSVVLWGATGHGKELSGRVAAKLDLGLATDCIDVRVENGELLLIRPIYAGKAIATVKAKTLPVMVSIRPNIFPPVVDDNAGAEIKQLQLVPVPVRAKVTEAAQKEEKGVDLAEAKVVISGGRGVKSADGFGPLRELAKTLNGALGASRAAVDSGWIDYTHQVGQTGKTVAPQLYIAAGISGAIQHLAGMSSSKVIVAINKDAEAPIFKIADYGIVGDLFEVVPALNEEFKKLLANN